ncbi:MAG TPA: Uma2 family endonuclease [Gemmata sp.]|nr:Uma2 family endonuclease [Gemmata sp.]
MILKAATSQPKNDYPTSDGKPMAETDIHRDLMLELIETLKWWFRDEPSTYVSGNLLIFYEKGDKRKHVSPDVFVVPKVGNHRRDNYLLWDERPLELVIELTSKTTMIEDIEEKYNLYVEKLSVKEYFLFDPKQEYLKPSFQGYRKASGRFVAIKPVGERLPSKVLGLHLERDGDQLRLWNPATGERVPTPAERLAQAESAAMRANELAAENERLQQELARLRGKK